MTIDEAINEFNKLLDNPHSTLDNLSCIVNQLSVVDQVAPRGAVTHLYTKIGNQKGFITPSVRVLDHTEAFVFLDKYNDEIYDFTSNVIRRNNSGLSSKQIKEMTESFFYGNFKDKGNVAKGLWGEISERFAKSTAGDVICHIGDVSDAPNRIWWNTEMPQVLSRNSKVTSINGIPANHVAFDKKYISAVCDAVYEISKSSNTRTHYVNFELLLETMWEFSEIFCTKASEKAF